MASFLSALKTRCAVHEVNGGRDFRLGRNEEDIAERRKGGGTWYVGDRDGFEREVERLTGGKEGELRPCRFMYGVHADEARETDERECIWTEGAGALGCGQGG